MDSNSIQIKTQTALTRILKYALPHKVAVVLALLGLVIVAATETAIPALLKPLLDRGFSGKLDDKLWYVPAFFQEAGQGLYRKKSARLDEDSGCHFKWNCMFGSIHRYLENLPR
jgi:hypothetical protein